MLKLCSLWLCASLLFVQCAPRLISQSYNPPTEYEAFKQRACLERPQQVYVFHAGEPLDFEYERLGKIHYDGVSAYQGIKAEHFVRYKAHQQCANGIIITNHDMRDLPIEYDTLGAATDFQTQAFITAIAINIETDSAFIAKNAHDSNMALFRGIENQTERVPNPNPDPMRGFFNTIGAIGLLALLIMPALSEDGAD